MAKYKIFLTRSAEKTLSSLPKQVCQKIATGLGTLTIQPFPQGCRKLSGEENTYRIRIGVYRVIYEVFIKEIIIKVLKIGHRKDVYRSF